MPHATLFSKDKENKENVVLQKRASMLSLNSLRRVSTSSFYSQRSLAPQSPNNARSSSRMGSRTFSRLRDSFMGPRESAGDLISMPVPVEDSQKKFSSKLRAQASLLDLADSKDAFAARQRALLDEMLGHCDSKTILKDEEASQLDVDLDKAARVVPFGPGGLEQQTVRELATYKAAPPGFIQTKWAYVVGSEELICLHHELVSGGTPLSSFKLMTWAEAYEVFWQVAASLASAERRLQFEHRDLIPENILVDRNPFTARLTVTIQGLEHARLRLPNGEVAYSRLDHHYFFNAPEERRDVYRAMQRMLIETSNDRAHPEWDQFQPRTNVLWLHVLVTKLLTSVQAPENMPKKRLTQIEAVLNPRKRRLMRIGFRDLDSAGDVVAWGGRALRGGER